MIEVEKVTKEAAKRQPDQTKLGSILTDALVASVLNNIPNNFMSKQPLQQHQNNNKIQSAQQKKVNGHIEVILIYIYIHKYFLIYLNKILLILTLNYN